MKRNVFTHKAKVEVHGDGYFARQPSGQLWVIPTPYWVGSGDTILISIPDPKGQYCSVVRQAPELAD